VTIVEQGSGPAPDLIKETTTQTFVKDVIEESKRQPVLIDFWAPWCGPCRQLTPTLEKAVRAANGRVKLVKMNIDEHPAIPGQMGIQSIPAVIAFVDGRPADGFMGAVPESQVTAFIDKLTAGMPGEPNIAEVLKEAEAVLAEGDPATAAQIYAEVLAADATNIAALAGLAKCYVATGAVEQARQTLAMVPESKRNDAAVKAVQASLDLAEQAKSVGPVIDLEQKVAANPLDHRPDLTWRPRSTPPASAPRPRRRCSRSSSATANGTRTAPASNWYSSSRRGGRTTRRPSRDESGCRPFCFRSACSAKVDTGFAIRIRAKLKLASSPDRRCLSMPNIAGPATCPR
jgi:putative thioredoxin